MHADMVGNFLYFIVSGYKGDNCADELNPCESNPCWNTLVLPILHSKP
jgi:hypothetical protein